MDKKKKEKPPKPKYNMAQTTAFMIKTAWVSKEKKVLVLSFLSAAFAVITNLLGLYVSPTLISILERGFNINELLFAILFFTVAMMLSSAINSYIESNEIYGRITVRSEIINSLNNKSATTSYPNLFNEKYLELLQKSFDVVSNNAAASEAVWTTLTTLLKNILGFAIYIALLSSVQPILFVIVLITATISYFATKKASNYRYEHREEESDVAHHMYYVTSVATELEYAKDIRIFGLAPWLEDVFNKAQKSYKDFQQKAESRILIVNFLDLVMAFLRNGAAYALLIAMVVNGEIDVAEFLLYFAAVSGFSSWVTGILGGFNTLYKQSLDISTVMETLDYPDVFSVNDGKHIERPETPFEIRLENVSYRYDGAEKDTLSDINLVLRPKEKLAIVGLNGAGKTTLVKILCGFVDPTKGRVLINGEDLKNFNRTDYYKLFSAVFQDFTIIPASIAANVAQTETSIDYEKVSDCIEKAGLTQKVNSLSNGLQTKLNRTVYDDAVLLSGGETQRLMLARALYKNAPFVVLDEPTAALDPIAESELYSKYNELTENKSSIYISHRLASTRFCDRIILIDNAKIAEEGSHDELIAKEGKYAELFEVQSKYYKEEAQNEELR